MPPVVSPEGPAGGGGLKVFPFVSCTSFVRPSRELAERFPTVPWASAKSHAFHVVTWPARRLLTVRLTVTVAGAFEKLFQVMAVYLEEGCRPPEDEAIFVIELFYDTYDVGADHASRMSTGQD